MICPNCKSDNKKSTVHIGASSVTCMGYIPFYDEEGNYHNHDSNISTTNYTCSHGHSWSDQSYNKCWCGWSGEPVDTLDRYEEEDSRLDNLIDMSPYAPEIIGYEEVETPIMDGWGRDYGSKIVKKPIYKKAKYPEDFDI